LSTTLRSPPRCCRYTAAEFADRTYTNALIIVKNGRIVTELYRNQTTDMSHFISFSMAKSITSLLIGIAVADGSIHSIDDMITAYVPELKNSAYDGVSIRQALDMRSGADYQEVYVSGHPDLLATAFVESLVENRAYFADFARTLTRAYPPGAAISATLRSRPVCSDGCSSGRRSRASLASQPNGCGSLRAWNRTASGLLMVQAAKVANSTAVASMRSRATMPGSV
jgi:hypothetical protein